MDITTKRVTPHSDIETRGNESLKLALKKEATMLSYMDVFVRIASNHEYVATAGEQFLVKLRSRRVFHTEQN